MSNVSASRVLAAMSGGVDSSVAAALALEAGHEVVGVTMRLWDNQDISGCCSVAEVDDARRVAHQLDIDHWTWSFTDDFESQVVAPYAAAHAAGRTPNPCIECNRHLKFGRFLDRAMSLGFDAVVTGHHARVVPGAEGAWHLHRGADAAKDQSYVLYVLGQEELARSLFPVGAMTKAEVRRRAAELGLATADKPDSQDACFVSTSGGRGRLLGGRIALHPGSVVDTAGVTIGAVEAVELVTVGQRRGLGTGGGQRRYVVSVDPVTATVVAGSLADLAIDAVELTDLTWIGRPAAGEVLAQTSAHGEVARANLDGGWLRFSSPRRRVAPGQSVVLYRGDEVLGGGIAL